MDNPIDTSQLTLTTGYSREIDCVRSFMKNSSEFRILYEYVWARLYSEYLNSRNTKGNILQRANLKLPYAWTIIETFTPQIVEAFMSEAPYITAIAREEFDPEKAQVMWQLAQQMSKMFSFQLDRMKFFDDFSAYVKNMLIYGTAIAKVGWIKNEKMLPARQMVDGTMKKITQPVTLYEGPVFRNIDIIDFYPDWGATQPGNIQAMRACVHRIYRSMEELRVNEKKGDEGLYINLDEVNADIAKHGYNAWTEPSNTNVDWPQSMKAYAFNQWPGQKLKGKIELWEYWGQFEQEDGSYKEKVITIANGRTVIRCDDNPYDYALKPFIGCVDHIVPGEFYGQGELEPLYSLFKEAACLRNARLDQVNQAVNRMFIIDRNAGINVRNFYSRTSGIVLANNIDGIKLMDTPEVPASSYQELNQIDYEIQNASSMINASQSTSNLGQAFGNTARGIGFLQGTMTSRMGMKIRMLENMVMSEFGRRLSILNRQFLSPEQWKAVNGDAPNVFEMFPSEDFYNTWDFTAASAIDRISRDQRQAQFQQAIIPFLQFVENAQPGTMKMDGLVSKFFKEFNIQDPYSYINPPQVQQQIAQQKFQQQMMMQEHEYQAKTAHLLQIETMKAQAEAQRQTMKDSSSIEKEEMKQHAHLAGTLFKGALDNIAHPLVQGGMDARRDARGHAVDIYREIRRDNGSQGPGGGQQVGPGTTE